MGRVILEIVVIVQCLMLGLNAEVNNIVKSKLLFSNQDLIEKNTQVVLKTNRTIMTRGKILEFLKQQVTMEDQTKLQEFFELMGPEEVRHIDFLIFLMNRHKTAAHHLLQSIFEILKEDETNLQNLMNNLQ